MHLGLYELDLNPPLDLPTGGYGGFSTRPVAGFYDRLYAKAVSIRVDDSRAILVSLDSVGIRKELADQVKEELESAYGVPRGNVIIMATHTHCAPETLCWSVPWFYPRQSDPQVEAYSRSLKEKITTAAAQAMKYEEEVVSATSAVTEIHGMYVNRNDPSRPIDNQVTSVLMRGRRSLALVNHANHPTILGMNNVFYSADFPGFLSRTLTKALEVDQVNCITGACGDVSAKPILGNEYAATRNIENAKRYGQTIGDAAARALNSERATEVDLSQMRVAVEPVTLELKKPTSITEAESNVARLRAKFDKATGWSERIKLEQAVSGAKVRVQILDINKELPPRLHYEVGALYLGAKDFALVWAPGELFAETGLKVKSESKYGLTMISGYANGYAGYFASHRSFREEEYEANFTPLSESSIDEIETKLLSLVS